MFRPLYSAKITILYDCVINIIRLVTNLLVYLDDDNVKRRLLIDKDVNRNKFII